MLMHRTHDSTPSRRAAAGLLLATLVACATGAPARATTGGASLSGVQALVADRLYFGRNIPSGGEVSDSAWSAFLLDVVTPRFPSGFTVWRAEGQWLDPRGTLVRESTMVVEILHPRGEPADSVFRRIAERYRARFHQDAVLRSTNGIQTELYESPITQHVDSGARRSTP